jgi:protein TonB
MRKLESIIIATLLATCAPMAHGQQATADIPVTKALAIYAPTPQYPYEARTRGIRGGGVFVVNIDPKAGLVRSVTVAHSTGSPILDNAAKSAFSQWRFKPGTVSAVRIPVGFGVPAPRN